MSERRATIAGYRGPLDCIGPDRLDALDATEEWVAEEKYDGCWARVVVRGGVIAEVVSRAGLDLDPAWAWPGVDLGVRVACVLHGEAMDDGALHLWDLVERDGEDLRGLALEMRREALRRLYASTPSRVRADLHMVDQRATGFRTYYDQVMARGGEGLVLKRRGSTLLTRRRDGKLAAWLKIKISNR
ncbi:MAG: hypothetical protein AAB706_03395 [Patescibacteria group bacterium]